MRNIEDFLRYVNTVTQSVMPFSDERTQKRMYLHVRCGRPTSDPEVRSMMAIEPVSPFEVREQLLRCFTQENGERFAEQERALGLSTGARGGVGGVETMVRLAFQQVGGDFEAPSRVVLTRVANLLSERSLEWGAPAELVLECHEHLMRQIAGVEDLPMRRIDTAEPRLN